MRDDAATRDAYRSLKTPPNPDGITEPSADEKLNAALAAVAKLRTFAALVSDVPGSGFALSARDVLASTASLDVERVEAGMAVAYRLKELRDSGDAWNSYLGIPVLTALARFRAACEKPQQED